MVSPSWNVFFWQHMPNKTSQTNRCSMMLASNIQLQGPSKYGRSKHVQTGPGTPKSGGCYDLWIKKSWEIFKRYQELASNSLHSRTGEPELIGTQEIHLGAPSLGKTPCWREYSTRQAAILSFRHVGRQLTLNRNIRQMRFLPCGAQLMLVGLYEKNKLPN
jgi:hypothetical protein